MHHDRGPAHELVALRPQSKSRCGDAEDSESEHESSENRALARNNAKGSKHKPGPPNSRAAPAGNGKGRKRSSGIGEATSDKAEESPPKPLQQSNKHNNGSTKRTPSHSDDEDQKAAVKRSKHAHDKAKHAVPAAPASHGGLRSLEDLSAEQQEREEASKVQKSRARSKPGKNGEIMHGREHIYWMSE